MGLKLEIDVSEISKVTQRLGGIKVKASDIRGVADGIRLLMQEDVDNRFQNAPSTTTGGEVSGGAYWEQLSEAYMRSKPYRQDGQILRDTGELLQSMTVEGHPYRVAEATESEIVFGTALIKARKLQKKRPFIFWHPLLLERVAGFLINYINE